MALEDFYNINPIAVVDQNSWDDRIPEVVMNFQRGPTIYSPLIDWTDRSKVTGAQNSIFTDLLEGDVNNDDIAFTANYIEDPLGLDSRQRELSVKRYGDKVQVHKSSNYFQMWKASGGRNWQPLLRGILGNNVRRKIEILSRNAFLLGPKSYWTYAGGATNFAQLGQGSTFGLEPVNAWNLRMGNTGVPVIPGDKARAKLAIVPPGSIYDFHESLAAASTNEAQMWRDSRIYSGEALNYEMGSYKNIRFVEAPTDSYGLNPAVLYNAGKIFKQCTITASVSAGDGAPDPETTKVDETWRVGQKGVTHYIQLSDFAEGEFAVNDFVSIHTLRTNVFGVTNGVNFLSGKTIVRRVVAVDPATNRISFDRPIMSNAYKTDLGGGVYGYVTKAVHVGFNLILGSRGGIMGNVNKEIEFYEPKPVDDFESVWRYVWDINAGWNIWEPNLFECHFTAVSLPKPGGIITPDDLYS